MGVRLSVVEGKARGAEFALGDKLLFEIGSAPWVDVPLDDPDVANVHLKLSRDQDQFCAFDLSGRGFLHNGKRSLKAELADGDLLELGHHKLRFVLSLAGTQSPARRKRDLPDARPGAWLDEAGPDAPAPHNERTNPDAQRPAQAPPKPRPRRFVLQAIRGNDTGKTYDLTEKHVFVMGRGVATDITVWDIRASRIHCRIDRQDGELMLTDLNSSNGTFVNGKRVETHHLSHGDEIRVGSTVLKLEVN